MVLYYSATGNTRYVAEIIAEKLGDETLDLLERIRTGDTSVIRSKKPFVICSPVLVCEMPLFLMAFLKKLKVAGNRKVYFVFTCGGYSGISGTLAKTIARKKNMLYMGHTEIIMPNNYVANTHYGANDRDEILFRIENAKYTAQSIALKIKNGKTIKGRYVFQFEKIVTLPFTPLWTRFKQPCEPFHASDKCVGCGKCVSVCPINNIRLNADKKPEWNAPCAHCMACICNCPTKAIDYGDITQTKDKYNIKNYLKLRG